MSGTDSTCNENTYAKLYQKFSEGLWRFAFLKCGDRAEADDLVQEAFIKLWDNCIKVPPEKAKSFLFTVTNNKFLNMIAHRKIVLDHAALAPRRIENESPEDVLRQKEFHQKLQQAIADLSEAQRTAFLLNRIEGKKYHEIAEMLDISVKAVEKRMSSALQKLRAEIGDV